MSFTPGPWKIKQGSRWGEYMIYALQKKAGRQVEQPVAFTVDHNARAIAQVPEMVDLLDDVAMELSIISPILQPTNGHVEALIERIDAILRRIEGEEETHEL